jgi:deazaflavin-dependent oxidoreductase (nitroreductase family)
VKVVICGAGIAGLTLAERMQTHGWEVCVLEHAPGPREQGYMLDFIGPGYDAAEAMGVLSRLKQVAYRVDQVAYVDRYGRRRARIDYTPFARLLRGRLLSIMRPDLETALREQLTDRVDLRFGCSMTAIDNSPAGVGVTLADGTRVDADVLVGADGIHSTVRRLTFGPEEQFFRYLGFHAAAYIFQDAEIHRRVDGRFCLTDSTMRLMGLYGLRDGRVATFCVHRTPDPTLPADPRAALQRIYASLGWVVPRAVDRCPPSSDLYYDQVAQVEVPRWTRGRVTLVGDACHAVSLLAGQGASLAVGGAYVLGELLAAADSIEAALARYEQVWRPVVVEKQRVGRRGAQWFLPKTHRQVWARRIMLGLSTLPVVDRYVGMALIGKSTVRVAELAQPRAALDFGAGSRARDDAASSREVSVQRAAGASGRLNARALFARSHSPVLRAFLSAPSWLYRLRLGWLLGNRFMLLAHRGRTSGRVYRTVLEVVRYDPRTHESVACSGWGLRADWYRNIGANPPVAVETGGQRYENPSFRVLAPEENYPIVADYVRRLPSIARPLAYRLGVDVRGPEEQRRAHSERLLMVAFRPGANATTATRPRQSPTRAGERAMTSSTAEARPVLGAGDEV